MSLIKIAFLLAISLFVLAIGISSAIERQRVITGDDPVQAIAFSPDGKTVALASGAPDAAGIIRLFSAKDMKPMAELRGHKSAIACLQFAPDSTVLLSGSLDNDCCVWNVDKRQLQGKLIGHTGRILSLSISPDGSQVATSSDDRSVVLWNLSERQVARKIAINSPVSRAIAFLPKVNVLATGSDDHTIRLWDTNTGNKLFVLDKNLAKIHSIAAFPDGKRLAVASADGSVKVWGISIANKTANDIISWKFGNNTPFTLAVTPNEQSVIIGTRNGQISICTIQDNLIIAELKINAHKFPVFSLAMSADGQTLASGSLLEPDMIIWRKWPAE